MSLFSDLEKSLLEAIEMEKGTVTIQSRNDMPAPTLYVVEKEEGDSNKES